MEKDLRLVRFPDDGEVITILPSYGGSLKDEPGVFVTESLRFSIKCGNVEYAKVVAKKYDNNYTIAYFQHIICDSHILSNSINAISEYLLSKGVSLVIIYNNDTWLESLLKHFDGYEFGVCKSGINHCCIKSYENS